MTVTTLPPLPDLITEMRRLAAERPDFVYVGPSGLMGACFNVHRDREGQPIPGQGCIIGRALTNLGYVFDVEQDGAGVDELYDWDDEKRLRWAARVQRKQDGGETWASAVATADAMMEVLS
jgi:hypothetical protein